MQTPDPEQQPEIFTVSRLNSEVRTLLEESFPYVWVEGEISNFAAPASGHWYFSLKDANAQVRCAMFRGNQRKLGFTPKDGTHVLIKARVSMYENRGEFQLIAEFMEERGEGKLRRAFEALKKRLEAAGLFKDEHKKSLPEFPRCIGIITSSTGAAIRDILHVLKRRYPCAPVIIYPTLVQGSTAAPAIVKAIQTANQRNECDVLILARGGGSLEDLWPFNEEIVAHAIYQSTLPIISGIGHEVDFTIADFVADLRAPTPSAAAEMSTPDLAKLMQTLTQQHQHLMSAMTRQFSTVKKQLEWTQKHLAQLHPKRKLTDKMQRLDFCELTLRQLLARKIHRYTNNMQELDKQLQRISPAKCVLTLQHQTGVSLQKLLNAITTRVALHMTALGNAAATLDALSPLATLSRGFAIVTHHGKVLCDASTVKVQDEVKVRLTKGTLTCDVKTIAQE
jgi:exodeoxyribonuclease VII large subunit